ncbi:MAG: hypothetical protein ABL903_11650 [Methylococcales bacterium]
MIKSDTMPMWVFLAFSSINTRKAALILIWSCLIFTLYCIPWVAIIPPNNAWISKLFLIDDWSWFAMMLPMSLWYWLSLKWVDKHIGWENS